MKTSKEYNKAEAIVKATNREIALLEERNKSLEGRLMSCIEERKEATRVAVRSSTVTALARRLADEYQKHPWANSAVYDAGQELIEAVRELE